MSERIQALGSTPALASIPALPRCPLCGQHLSVDACWATPHWLCPNGHGYSNPRTLLLELEERGWLMSAPLAAVSA